MEKDNNKSLRKGLLFFGRISTWVVFPIVLSLFVGKWLDRIYNSENLFFLISTAIAFAISIFGIVKETRKYIQ